MPRLWCNIMLFCCCFPTFGMLWIARITLFPSSTWLFTSAAITPFGPINDGGPALVFWLIFSLVVQLGMIVGFFTITYRIYAWLGGRLGGPRKLDFRKK